MQYGLARAAPPATGVRGPCLARHAPPRTARSCHTLTRNPSASSRPALQRLYGFEASKYGITDSQAADIATVFSAFDADDNGVLSLDEFQRLW